MVGLCPIYHHAVLVVNAAQLNKLYIYGWSLSHLPSCCVSGECCSVEHAIYMVGLCPIYHHGVLVVNAAQLNMLYIWLVSVPFTIMLC